MDGVMFMHSERLKRVRAVIDDGATIGKLRRIVLSSTFAHLMSFLRKTLECIAILSRIRLEIWVVYDPVYPLGDAVCDSQSINRRL